MTGTEGDEASDILKDVGIDKIKATTTVETVTATTPDVKATVTKTTTKIPGAKTEMVKNTTRRLASSTKDHFVDYIMTTVAKKLSSSVAQKHINKSKGEPLRNFSLSVFASSLVRINQRTRLLSYIQPHVIKFLSWEHPSYTILILCIYTVLCFKPYLIVSFPLIGVLIGILIPGYNHRHPFPDYLLPQKGPPESEFNLVDSSKDIALMKNEQKALLAKNKKGNENGVKKDNQKSTSSDATSKGSSEDDSKDDEDNNLTTLSIKSNGKEDELILNPTEKETSDIIKSIRQLQALLNNIANLLDAIEDFFYGLGSFSGDERKSTALYLLLLLGIFLLPIGASLIPVNFALASIGWFGIGVLHPAIGKEVKRIQEEYLEVEEEVLLDLFNQYENYDIIIDNNGPEDIRSVEVFELQRQGLTPRLWDAWLFSPIIYSERSIFRISEDRPPGCGHIDNVLPPPGWYFLDDHPWELDDNTKGWVFHRGVVNVEIDLDEHWAYDYKDGVRGEWRRRRWVRQCFRGSMEPRKR